MADLVITWYAWLSRLAQGPVFMIDGWLQAVNVPMVSALLFGLIGATSPCQLTTNLGALAFSARQADKAGTLTASFAYVLGKVLVYSVVGGLIILLGLRLQAASIPVVLVARRALGPLMVLTGLGMLGVMRFRGALGQRWSRWLRRRLPTEGRLAAFLLGVAFSFAFCPTLFWLFFGLTVPLALKSPAGWSFPALFAVGTGLPLLVVASAVSLGLGAAEGVAGRMQAVHRIIGRAAGFVFILAGLHDSIVYWWL
ncbi:MAG TPA: sulfite exporter TauE/SafE family protein [Methylomirabilota bacterium]|nr:sulfite exporter TauE/SafE family protein [Methylomirabilota bacterium]